MKIAFFTLGCKVNQYETQVLKQQFASNDFQIVEPNEVSDIYVVNSCTVTATSDKKTRQVINKLKSINNNAIIVLTGCFPQAFPEKAAQIKTADVITGTKDRNKIYDLVIKKLNTRSNTQKTQEINIISHATSDIFEKMNICKFNGKTRAFIKIQDGCNRFCSYCIIPAARGRARSKTMSDIISEVSHLADNGHQEIVLTGINLSSYGQDINLDLVDVVESISKVKKVKRIRLSSLEPDLLKPEHINRLAKIDKFCPSFHLCLQSGCNTTLKRMNRHYSTDEYSSIVQIIRELIDNPSITTDLIVGFPGETQQEFHETLSFIEKIKFAKIHIFPYSKRPGTRAALMKDQIYKTTKQQRCLLASNLAKRMQSDFFESQIKTVSEVLFETQVDNNLYQGYSKNYTPIIVSSPHDICGQIKLVEITTSNKINCEAKLLH